MNMEEKHSIYSLLMHKCERLPPTLVGGGCHNLAYCPECNGTIKEWFYIDEDGERKVF